VCLVSVEAISWALNLAPVPLDPSGKPNSSCAFVLVGLANHASPDGTSAFPSAATLVRYTRLSERTVRTALDRLETAGLITPCRPEIVAAHIRRADHRPQGWDIDITQVRTDLTERDIATLERQFPGLRARIAPADGVQPLHPEQSDGVQLTQDGVQLTQPRGAAVAPEPYIEPSIEPEPLRGSSRRPPASRAGDNPRPKLDQPGDRDDVERVCGHLADRMAERDGERPNILKCWRTDARLMLDKQKRAEAEIHELIDWCQDHHFWATNIRSIPKFKYQFLRLRDQKRTEDAQVQGRLSWEQERDQANLDVVARFEAREQAERAASQGAESLF
jgi:hypothetical protein